MIIRLDGDGLWYLLWQTGSVNLTVKPFGNDDDDDSYCSSAADGSSSRKEVVVLNLLIESLPHPIPPPLVMNRFKKHRCLLEGIV